MVGFCEVCGRPLGADGRCPDEACESGRIGRRAAAAAQLPGRHEIGPLLNKPSTALRLFGSGIEFALYTTAALWIAQIDLMTCGTSTFLSLALFALVMLRDVKAGAFSLAKRVAHTRVVDWRTGRVASNAQAVLRNVYYLVIVLVGVVPIIDPVLIPIFLFFVALDGLMIVTSRQGRRLGDLLAGTQVVATRS